MGKLKVFLSADELPKSWYNVLADLPFEMEPPLDPETNKPISPEKLSVIFPKPLIEQEVSMERWLKIPERVLQEYALYRPTPLIRAENLEEFLNVPAKIFFKYEGVSPTGSHKTNTAIAQAYYNKIDGTRKLVTETGAGQWGSALAYAGSKFGVEVEVFMVKVSFKQKPMRKYMMEIFGATVHESPSDLTEFGKKILEKDPDSPGSLGIAISEALEVAVKSPDVKYSLGSVLNHVLLHQTVIGLEIKRQLEIIGEKADVIIGCHGGGSNFGGTILPFVPDKLSGENVRFVAVEPIACPSLTNGEYRYDSGDTAGLTPLLKMYTLGRDFVPPPIHAGGLRYHGSAPIIAKLVKEGLVEAVAYDQEEIFKWAKLFAKLEGVIPAPESAHAITGAVKEALLAKEEGKEKVVVFTLSGHGLLDLTAYSS